MFAHARALMSADDLRISRFPALAHGRPGFIDPPESWIRSRALLHPELLATDHEMRASSSMSSSEMGVETRAGWRVCGVSSLSSWPPDQSRHCSNQNRRMSSTSTSRVPSRISGAWACSRAVITSDDADPGIMNHGRSDLGAGAMGFGLDARLPASSVRGRAAGRLNGLTA